MDSINQWDRDGYNNDGNRNNGYGNSGFDEEEDTWNKSKIKDDPLTRNAGDDALESILGPLLPKGKIPDDVSEQKLKRLLDLG